jgi:hypothetical protein
MGSLELDALRCPPLPVSCDIPWQVAPFWGNTPLFPIRNSLHRSGHAQTLNLAGRTGLGCQRGPHALLGSSRSLVPGARATVLVSYDGGVVQGGKLDTKGQPRVAKANISRLQTNKQTKTKSRAKQSNGVFARLRAVAGTDEEEEFANISEKELRFHKYAELKANWEDTNGQEDF